MNIYDIARLAGVSSVTVSRVINNGNVSAATKEKVMKIINENSYTPSVYARGMSLSSMSIIGVIVSDLSDLYSAKAVSVIEHELRKNKFDMNLYCTGDEIENADKYIKYFAGRKTDGVIFVGSKFKNMETRKSLSELSKKMPVVMINADMGLSNVYSVVANDRKAISKTVEYLFVKGCRKFLYLFDAHTESGQRKQDGFKEGIEQCSLPNESGIISHCPRGIESATEITKKAFKKYGDIDAIITSQDELAVGALKAAQALCIDVPEKLCITGYDNTILSEACTPSLTTVNSGISALSEFSVKLMLDVIAGKSVSKKITIDCEVVRRHTTR